MSVRSLFLAAALLGADMALAADTAVSEVSATAATAAALQKADAAHDNADFKEAYAIYKTLDDRGRARDETGICLMYANGELGKRDMAEAIAHYDKAAAAGDGYAQYQLGLAFREGTGVEKDTAEAEKWFVQAGKSLHQAALRQDAEAQYFLSLLYRNGLGVVKDLQESGRWLQKAAEKGYPSAQVAYGRFLYEENKDTVGLLAWWEKAANQGNWPAQVALARAYTKGDYGIPKEQTKVDEWYRRLLPALEKAARQGSIYAQTELGKYYLAAKDVPAASEKAQEWLEKAATQGSRAAQTILGMGYLKGEEGFTANPEKAQEWLEKAAQQGSVIAQSILSISYLHGDGLPTDPEKARYWSEKVEKAAAQGDETARALLRALPAK